MNMMAGTEPVEGFFSPNLSDHVCWDCSQDSDNVESIDNPEVDCPIHCSICGVPLECRLTHDAIKYVKEALENCGGCCFRIIWKEIFADYL